MYRILCVVVQPYSRGIRRVVKDAASSADDLLDGAVVLARNAEFRIGIWAARDGAGLAMKHHVTVHSPRLSPTVLDQPVILAVLRRSIANQLNNLD